MSGFSKGKTSGHTKAQQFLLSLVLGLSLCAWGSAAAQQETETSPIAQAIAVTASVDPSCSFWLDRTWISLGAYEGNMLAANNRTNIRCSVLPSGLEGNNFAPACIDAGLHYVPQANANDVRSPRTMLLEGGDPSNPNHRLQYNISSKAQFDNLNVESAAIGTGHDGSDPDWGQDSTQCVDASPNGNLHPGFLAGYEIGPGGAANEVPNQTFSTDIVFFIYDSQDQSGEPVPGNYSDTVTIYFVFKDP